MSDWIRMTKTNSVGQAVLKHPLVCSRCEETDYQGYDDNGYPVAVWLHRLESLLFDENGNKLIDYDRLRELAEAEREGRVVVLPVAIGTPVYIMFYFPPVMYLGGMTAEFMGEPIEEHAFDMDMLESWGETIFATRAEAERALAATEPKTPRER